MSEKLLEKLGAAVTISPISKEPSIIDIQKTSMISKGTFLVPPVRFNLVAVLGWEVIPEELVSSTLLLCRTVRIGSYRFVPPEPVSISKLFTSII